MIATRSDYVAAGGTFIEYREPREIFPGVWLTGPVPRKYPEKNWSKGRKLRTADGSTTEDNLPEDQSLVIVTGKGLVVVSGCGHSGIINTLDYARARISPAPVYAALGLKGPGTKRSPGVPTGRQRVSGYTSFAL